MPPPWGRFVRLPPHLITVALSVSLAAPAASQILDTHEVVALASLDCVGAEAAFAYFEAAHDANQTSILGRVVIGALGGNAAAPDNIQAFMRERMFFLNIVGEKAKCEAFPKSLPGTQASEAADPMPELRDGAPAVACRNWWRHNRKTFQDRCAVPEPQ